MKFQAFVRDPQASLSGNSKVLVLASSSSRTLCSMRSSPLGGVLELWHDQGLAPIVKTDKTTTDPYRPSDGARTLTYRFIRNLSLRAIASPAL